jgi:hypothetical protein
MGKFFFWLLKRFGWRIDDRVPNGVKKAVVVMGPHTSNWDFVIGKIAFAHYKESGIKAFFYLHSIKVIFY